MAAKPKVNYTLLEADWKAGLKSTRQMAADYEILTGDSVTHAAIAKHFEDVPRDKQARIRARIEEMVSTSAIDAMVAADKVSKVADEAIIEAAAQKGTEIILAHQKEITRYRTLAQKLLAEIETTSDNLELFDTLGECLRSENERGVDKLNDAYKKVIDLPGRVDSFKKLAEVLKVLIGLERQAFGMADNPDGGKNAPPAPAPQGGTSDVNDAARRIAFLFMSATHTKEK
jgi:hypothetical protein